MHASATSSIICILHHGLCALVHFPFATRLGLASLVFIAALDHHDRSQVGLDQRAGASELELSDTHALEDLHAR